MAFVSLTRRLQSRLKRDFARILDINAGHTTKSWHFLIESQSNYEPTRDRPISQDPTNADRSLQLFPPHILPLCNVWQHLNTRASQVMQVYASHRIALNKSRLKILAHVPKLECKLLIYFRLFVIVCVYASKVLLYYSTVNSKDTVYALSVRTCHIYSYYQQKLVTLRSVQGVY